MRACTALTGPSATDTNSYVETFEKCSILFKFKGNSPYTGELDSRQAARKGDPAGLRESQREDFNRRNTLSILSIQI
jgi:hypothetical protein